MHLLAMLTSVRTTFYTMMRHTVWRVACGVWRVVNLSGIQPRSLLSLSTMMDRTLRSLRHTRTRKEKRSTLPMLSLFTKRQTRRSSQSKQERSHWGQTERREDKTHVPYVYKYYISFSISVAFLHNDAINVFSSGWFIITLSTDSICVTFMVNI